MTSRGQCPPTHTRTRRGADSGDLSLFSVILISAKPLDESQCMQDVKV